MTVLVKRGKNPRTYHKRDSDGTPCCVVNYNSDPDSWLEWSLDKAKAWREPCQNPACYGSTGISDQESCKS